MNRISGVEPYFIYQVEGIVISFKPFEHAADMIIIHMCEDEQIYPFTTIADGIYHFMKFIIYGFPALFFGISGSYSPVDQDVTANLVLLKTQ